MRIHRLTITAFGPFAGTETLDFDALHDAGIFLLTGQTGAGKTSVLDAVSFALFGAVPGPRNLAKTFKSQHASAVDEPAVTLEVTLRDRRLRIHRTAAWRRPSRRARDGFVDEHAKVTVEELAQGEWLTRATRLDEAGLLLRRLLGMTQEQFCQVVLLPQGQFETFLRAGAKERHDLLESLFETRRFQLVESWLGDERRRRDASWAGCRRQIDGLLARAGEVAEVVPSAEETGSPSVALDAILPALQARLHELWLASESARQESHDRVAAAKAAQHALDEATRLAERQARHHEATRRLDELTTLQSAVDQRVAHVERGRSAAALGPLLDLVDSSALAQSASLTALDPLVTATRPLLSDDAPDLAELPDAAVIATQLAHLQAELGRLEQLEGLEDESAALAARVDEHQGSITRSEAALSDLDERAARLPDDIAEVGRLLDETAVRAGHGAAAAQLRDLARSRLAGATEAARLRPAIDEAAARHLDLREARVVAREHASDVRQRRLAGIAAELAAELHPGSGCPVCGSTDHPEPATVTLDHVSDDDERAAQAGVEVAESDVAAAATVLESLRTAHAAATASSGGLSPEAATESLDLADQAVAQAAQAETRRHMLQTRADGLERRRQEVQTAHQACTSDLAALRSGRDSAQERFDVASRRLSTALAGHESVRSRMSVVDADVQRLARLADLVAEQRRLDHELADRLARLDHELSDSVFVDVEDLRSARLPNNELAALDALNRSHDNELAAVRRDLDDPALVGAAAERAPDLDALRVVAEVSADERAHAMARATALTHRVERLGDLLDELRDAVSEAAPVREARDLAERVASMCAGTAKDNLHKTRLSHYVVSARLEQVVDAANVRLRSIGGGRYQLEHSLTRGAGESRGGLSLRVLDTYTDLRRDPATLSGGETFYVSLALALGLADLVSMETDGAQLSTLFVDEGFGGLDADTLDEVMDEIDALRAGGRSVGLVSHLSELRVRVPTQVTIERGRHGSRIVGAR